MGFLDTLKQLFGGAASSAEQFANNVVHQQQPGGQQQFQQQEQQQQFHDQEPHEVDAYDGLDTAGFDWQNNEASFFDAIAIMDSEGHGGGTDEEREEIMSRFEIRDRRHWQQVRDSVHHMLAQKHGSMETVMQLQMNAAQVRMQRAMQGNIAARANSGEMAPVEGVSLEKWAAINAAIVQGNALEDLLKGNGIDPARWDRARTEWEARMSRDTTFAIAQVYGAAFQAASNSRFSDYAKEANAARAANSDVQSAPPMSVGQYFELLYGQDAAAKQGIDPQAALKAQGLSIVDWVDLSTYMGYVIHRTWGHNHVAYQAEIKAAEAKVLAQNPGVQLDTDIQF